MKLIKVLCALLAAVICLAAIPGCAYNPETVMTLGETKIPAGLYLFYQFSATQEAYTKYGDSSITSAKLLAPDSGITLGDDNVPVRDWINDKLMNTLREFAFVEQEFARLGLWFTDSDIFYYNYMLDSQWPQYEDLLSRNGVGYDNFKLGVMNEYKKSKVLTALYGEGGELEIPLADYEAYFTKNYTRVDYIQLPMSNIDSSPLDTVQQQTLVEIAERMVAAANTGGSLETAYLNYYGEIAELIGDTEEITDDAFTSAASLDVVTSITTATPDAELVKKFFEAQPGDRSYRMFYKEDAVVVIYRVNGLHEDDTYDDYKSGIFTDISAEPFEAYIEAGKALLTSDVDQKAVKRYSIDNIKFN